MSDWQWLTEKISHSWGFLLRVVLKAVALFVLFNLLFALAFPASLGVLGKLSLYNTVFAGRERLPAFNQDGSYSATTFNMPALVATHALSTPKAGDDFRVVMLGDSGTWGWLLRHDETVAAYLNQQGYTLDGQRVRVYNLAYPNGSVLRDLLLLDEALQHQPDMIIWMVSVNSFEPQHLYDLEMVNANPHLVQRLADDYGLVLDLSRYPSLNWQQRTIVGQRDELLAWLRLQSFSAAWDATGVDRVFPDEFPITPNDLQDDLSWDQWEQPETLTCADLPFDILRAGRVMAGDIPFVIAQAPMFLADGENSDLRYNASVPRWAYDQYLDLLSECVLAVTDSTYIDLRSAVQPEQFTDLPFHYTAEAAQSVATFLGQQIFEE